MDDTAQYFFSIIPVAVILIVQVIGFELIPAFTKPREVEKYRWLYCVATAAVDLYVFVVMLLAVARDWTPRQFAW